MAKKLENVTKVSGKLKETEEKITKQSFTKNGITRSIAVREVENGFIIEITEEGEDKKNGWYWATQTWISQTNPLDEDGNGSTDFAASTQETISKALENLKL